MPGSQAAPRRYDSFVVRLWTDRMREVLLRAEVQHVQTGLVEQGLDVTASWVHQAILHLLDSGVDGTDRSEAPSTESGV
jgi:hypothetical protein